MDHINSYLLKQFQEKNLRYQENFEWCLGEFSEESVHDLRVSIRRLISLCQLLDEFSLNSYSYLLGKYLRKQVKRFSPLRDTQVLMLATFELAEDFPILYPYRLILLENEIDYIDLLEKKLAENNPETVEMYNFFIAHSLKYSKSMEIITIEKLRDFSLGLLGDVTEKFDIAKENEMDTIHKVRLAFKKFRYIMEILTPVFNLSEDDLKELKKYQTLMGNIQDNNVFLAMLEEFIEKQNTNPAWRFDEIIEYKFQERSRFIDDFFLNFGSIKEFEAKIT